MPVLWQDEMLKVYLEFKLQEAYRFSSTRGVATLHCSDPELLKKIADYWQRWRAMNGPKKWTAKIRDRETPFEHLEIKGETITITPFYTHPENRSDAAL